jgi:hypothetical protein
MRKTLLKSVVLLVLAGVLIGCTQAFLLKSTTLLVLVSALTGCIQGYADPTCSYPAYLPHPKQFERLVLAFRGQASVFHQPIRLWSRLLAGNRAVWAGSRETKFKFKFS